MKPLSPARFRLPVKLFLFDVRARVFLLVRGPNEQLARAQLKVLIVISARPLEEYFETVPNVSLETMQGFPVRPARSSLFSFSVLARKLGGEAKLPWTKL